MVVSIFMLLTSRAVMKYQEGAPLRMLEPGVQFYPLGEYQLHYQQHACSCTITSVRHAFASDLDLAELGYDSREDLIASLRAASSGHFPGTSDSDKIRQLLDTVCTIIEMIPHDS